MKGMVKIHDLKQQLLGHTKSLTDEIHRRQKESSGNTPTKLSSN